jgi:hypothetical protein
MQRHVLQLVDQAQICSIDQASTNTQKLVVDAYLIRIKIEIDITELRIRVPTAHIAIVRNRETVNDKAMLTTNTGRVKWTSMKAQVIRLTAQCH